MEEYTVRSSSITSNKKYNVFKLHKDDNITWTEAKMKRENDNHPWQIKFGSGRGARRFKAIKEGGVNDNASYFIFYKPSDKSDTYEVCPVDEWYSVSATQRYKTLTAEEAEEQFEQRHKMLNLFSVMHLKKGENGDELVGAERDNKSFKVSELDDWDESGDDDGSGNEDDDSEEKKKLKRKKNAKKEKDDPDEAPDEGKEESDEGDFEQREVDYMSDTSSESSDEDEKKDETNVRGIAEEEALRDLLSTDDEDEGDNPRQKSKLNEGKITSDITNIKQDPGNSTDESSDSDDYDVDEEKMDSMFMKKGLPAQLIMSKTEDLDSNNSRQASTSGSVGGGVSGNKRKTTAEVSSPTPQPPPKRPCTTESSTPSSSQSANGQEKVVEDLIRKYLSRKPMTPKNLLKEIRSKLKRMSGVTPEMNNNLVNTIASIIKRLQPDKQKINEVTYLSLKS